MKRKFIFLMGVIICISLIIVVLVLIPEREPVNNSLSARIDEITKLFQTGQHELAESQLEALNPITDDPVLLLKLAKIHLFMGDLKRSRKDAEYAWAKGMKNREVIKILLIANAKLTSKDSLFSYISRFLDELPENIPNSDFKG